MEEPVSVDLPESSDKSTRKASKSDGKVCWDSLDAQEKVLAIRKFDVEEKIASSKYDFSFVKDFEPGKELSVSYLQKEGFDNPLHFADKSALDLKVPPAKGFGVSDIRASVGSRRCVDYMDTLTQKNDNMTMKEWHKYFESQDNRDRILNVISLEFSNTKLDSQVSSPRIVRQIDWIDKVWPRHLKELQIEPTNNFDDLMYPKVQKYCLMSVKKCFTDFHIDFGGTSVWYHILQGRKIFWLIPPTDQNLKLYEEWVLSGKQSEIFFGDSVEQCSMFEFGAGSTLFIPSGWIHAVYTKEDSIVFGGNFLHSFSIEKQLQIAHIEEITHVPSKFRFPFFTEMMWYVLERYIHCTTGKTHLDLPEEEKRRIRLEKGENVDPNKEVFRIGGDGNNGVVIPENHVHLTQAELHGIKFIVMYLHSLPTRKKNIPIMLPDPISIIKDIRDLVIQHKDDCPEKAVTGKYILRWSENEELKKPRKYIAKGASEPTVKKNKSDTHGSSSSRSSAGGAPQRKFASGNRRRRVRCKICEACLGGDCRSCIYCRDMVKYGGPGRMKQTCEKRRCLHPQLPVCAFCAICQLDGWYTEPKAQNKETERPENPPDLFECTVCLDIVHPKCAQADVGLGKVNEDLSNSWECAKCANSGYSTVPSRQGVTSKKRSSDEGMSDESKKNKL